MADHTLIALDFQEGNLLKIQQIFAGNSLRNFNYIVAGDQGDIFVIDPYDSSQLIPLIKNLKGRFRGIINTHEHADHTLGNRGLQEEFRVPVYAHQNARGKIKSVDYFLKKNDEIVVDDKHKLRVMDTPGHTFAHLCLLLLKRDSPLAVFTGDTLFNAGVGNCYNGGDPTVLYQTVKEQFLTLPDNVLVYPGHEYLGNNLSFTLHYWPSNTKAQSKYNEYKMIDPDKTFLVTTMGDEKEINLFLASGQKDLSLNLGHGLKTYKQIFLKLRELRDAW